MKQQIALFAILAAGALSSAPTPAAACACCGTWQVTNVAAEDVLNMRAGPSASYAKVGEIPSGTACVIKTGGCVANWCRVSYADMTGWVNVKYLRYKK
ncbi:MAG: SH3 domain-containing protein [Alphaproteobacteria bacterium]|nr:SH3 domain-containing protein [Alphaproteobacteria bacterium]